jgi:hypothetical protein
MSCKREILDIYTIITEDDIYPCKNNNCNYYHKSCSKHALIDAIFFLQFDRVKELVDNMTNEDLISMRIWKRNLLEYIQNEMKGNWTKEMTTLGNIRPDIINNRSAVNNDSHINILLKLTEILQYIFNKCPELYNESNILDIKQLVTNI